MISRRYRYGSSFIDRESGVRFEGHHPFERPDLWKRYLQEAEGRYRELRIRGHPAPARTRGGARRLAVLPRFRPRWGGGRRRPLPWASQCESSGLPDRGDERLARDRGDRPRHRRPGAPRCTRDQGCLVQGEAATGHRLVEAISRSVTHAMNWLGAEFAIAAVSDTLLPFGLGHRGPEVGTSSVPFPDERYRHHRARVAPVTQPRAEHARSTSRLCESKPSSSPAVRTRLGWPRRPRSTRTQRLAAARPRRAGRGPKRRCSGCCGKTPRCRSSTAWPSSASSSPRSSPHRHAPSWTRDSAGSTTPGAGRGPAARPACLRMPSGSTATATS